MKRLFLIMTAALTALVGLRAQEQYCGSVVAGKGAWCWFADPRALHYENASGTSGDNHPTRLTTWVLSMTYDGKMLTTYRGGLVDQVIETNKLKGGAAETYGDENKHTLLSQRYYNACASPLTVQSLARDIQRQLEAEK